MPQKPRHQKTAMQLWVMDNRKRLEETPADLARLTNVTVDTARGWESRGGPNEDAIRILEAHFGEPAPRAGAEATPAPADLSPYLERVDTLVGIVSQLVSELRIARGEDPIDVSFVERAQELRRTETPPQESHPSGGQSSTSRKAAGSSRAGRSEEPGP